MRKLILFTFLSILAAPALAGQTIRVQNNGSWNDQATWNLNRVPANGDTLLIPAGLSVYIDDNLNLSTLTLHLKIYGTLKMTKAGSKLSIGAPSTIYIYSSGRIEAIGNPSQVIQIGSNFVYSGSDGTVSGPQYATSSSSGFDSFSESTLPVKFTGFTLTRQGSNVLVQWATAEEINADSYELERSADGQTWARVYTVAASGTTRTVSNYAFTDRTVSTRLVYYRVRQLDTDGHATYTAVRSLRFSDAGPKEMGMAAIHGKVVLQFPETVSGPVTVSLFSLNGQLLSRHTLNGASGQVVLDAAPSARGLCVLSVTNGRDLQAARKLIF